MVIISDKFGQLGNRLFLFAHFIANAMEFDYRVCYPGFYEYAHFFKATRDNFFCRYPADSSLIKSCKPIQNLICQILNRSVSGYCRLNVQTGSVKVLDITSRDDFDGDYNLSEKEFIDLRTKSHLLFVKGWVFRDERNFRKHAESVRRFFIPVDRHAENVSRLIDEARKHCDILVGIHIRQGDYKTWLDGKHYYTTADYVNIIRQTGELWGKKRVRYLVCSNEKQDERLFEGLNCTWGTGDQLEDMYAFAACDYLIGPPSTYTMWASFYGSVPLLVVDELDTPLTLEGFNIC